jgi:hypothetical protein
VTIKREAENVVELDTTEKDLENMIAMIKNSKLPFEVAGRRSLKYDYGDPNQPGILKEGSIEYKQILIGKGQEELDRLKKALEYLRTQEEFEKLPTREQVKRAKAIHKSEEFKQYSEDLGLALGIPKTAVEAFVGKRESIHASDLPEKIRNGDAIIFLTSTLSKEHWQDELQQGQKYADYIKSVSPDTYRRMHEEYRGLSDDIIREIK